MIKKSIYVFIIPLLALILVSLWFKDGYMMGTAESIIPFYNLGRVYDQVKLAWANNSPGLGLANGIITAYAPTYLVLSLIEKFGVPDFLSQAIVFWILLTTAGFSVYFLGKVLFPNLHEKYLILGSLFYWFNFISLISIWHRFLYNFMFFWSFLPLGALIYILGLNRQNYIFVLILSIFSVIFSYALSAPVFILLFWLLLAFITLFWIIFKGNFNQKKFFLFFFLLSLGAYVIFNSWWIGQIYSYVNSGKYEADKSSFFVDQQNYSTFDSISKSDGKLIYVTRLMHAPFFEEPRVKWASFYLNPLSQILEFTVIGVCLLTIIRFRNNYNILFLSSGLLVSFFLVKGNSPPLGEIFDIFFKKFSIFQFFRDPFEKFGYMLPFFASLLLPFGLYEFSARLKNKYANYAYFLFLIIITIFYGYPFLSGLVFTSSAPPTDDYSVGYKVKVPEYYKQASDWLEKQGGNFRLLGMPFRDQGVTYKWEKGYQGVEPYSLLFSTPYIMVNTTVLYYDKVVEKLESLLINSGNFPNILNALNIRYMLIREDIDFRERVMRNPENLISLLNGEEVNKNLLKKSDFGKLKFWENAKWQDKTFYTSNQFISVFPQVNIENVTLREFSPDSVLLSGADGILPGYINSFITYPKSVKDDPGLDFSTQEFYLNEEGDYELLVNNLEISKEQIPSESLQITLDDTKFDSFKLREDGRISFGMVRLSTGTHALTVPILKLQSSPNDNEPFKLNKSSKKILVDNFNPFAEYQLEFNYSSNNNFKFRINQDTDQLREGKNLSSYERVLPQIIATSSASFKDLFLPRYTSSSMELEFQGEAAEVQVDNLNIKKVFRLRVLLVKNKNEPINLVKPKIIYLKSSPTKYTVNINNAKDPYMLVFSELYNPGWEARLENGETIGKHFLVNSYANGWVIDKLGDYDLIVEFAPQRLLDLGKIVSATAFIGGLGIVLLELLKRGKK